jgi:Ca2+-binding RTX toxin-like protein
MPITTGRLGVGVANLILQQDKRLDGTIAGGQGNNTLQGGNLDDPFILQQDKHLTGLLDGGQGNNTLQGGNVDNTWTITDENAGTGGTIPSKVLMLIPLGQLLSQIKDKFATIPAILNKSLSRFKISTFCAVEQLTIPSSPCR